jgi:hypothetical protein
MVGKGAVNGDSVEAWNVRGMGCKNERREIKKWGK